MIGRWPLHLLLLVRPAVRSAEDRTHPAAPRTARWPARRCPACCGGGGSASWSCSTAWTCTGGSAPARRTPPGRRAATARTPRPAESRRARGGAWLHAARTRRVRSRSVPADWCFCAAVPSRPGERWRVELLSYARSSPSTVPPSFLLPSSAFLTSFLPLSSSSALRQIPFRWKVNRAKAA